MVKTDERQLFLVRNRLDTFVRWKHTGQCSKEKVRILFCFDFGSDFVFAFLDGKCWIS